MHHGEGQGAQTRRGLLGRRSVRSLLVTVSVLVFVLGPEGRGPGRTPLPSAAAANGPDGDAPAGAGAEWLRSAVRDPTVLQRAPTELSAARWRWPTAEPAPLARPFRAPDTVYSAGHRGVDLALPAGTPVLAAADGIVAYAGPVVDRSLVAVQHDGGLRSSVEPVEPAVTAGDRVFAGQVIGVLSDTVRHCAASCLHFGVRLHGAYISPLLLIGGFTRPVLLPLE